MRILLCIKPSHEIEVEAGEEYSVALIANGIQDFNGVKFVISYNPEELEMVDLCEETAVEDILENGKISDTYITIESNGGGRIVLTINNSIEPGKVCNGAIDTLKLRSKIDGQVNVSFTVE